MNEMRVEVGQKESSNKKLVKSTHIGWSCRKMQMKNRQREQMPRKWTENGGEEDRNCEGDCIKSNLERVGEELNK